MKAEPSVQSLFDLTGRVALITGASGHLGSSMANALAEAGARVVVASRQRDKAESAAKSLPGTQKHCGVALDHMDEVSIQSGFTAAVSVAGKVDILVCNGHEPVPADWRTITGEQFTRQMQNATGYFLLSRSFRNHVVERKAAGSVVMVGSMYGVVGSYPEAYENIAVANPVAYQALKGGILQMVRHLAVYWAPDNIRVNGISPGPFPAPGVSSELVSRLEAKSPMHRMGKPHEMKGGLLFLCSDASSYVTGHNLMVDGGWTAW
jgi:gluconate 5-dehydrogenase